MKKSSSQKKWNEFWDRKQNVDKVYSNENRILVNLKKTIDLKGKRILEVGAGTGRDSFAMSEEGAIVYVLDYSPPAVKIIQDLNEHVDHRISPILGDTFSIPARDGSFDIVYHQGLLEHFDDPIELLKENARVLKDNGLLLIDVPQRYHYYTLIKHFLIWINKWFAGWETEFSIGELTRLTESLGLVVIHKYGDWKRPSVFYRIVRELFLKLHVSIPLYPKTFGPVQKVREFVREAFRKTKISFYTYLDIGVIARKKNHEL